MASNATNRSAAISGACSAVGLFLYSATAGPLLPSHEVLRWWINLFFFGVIFFIPFFKWVIGADFKADGQWFSLREQYHALPEKRARMGIWALSLCAAGVPLGLVTKALSK